jgi:predicted nuclease of predicted toxin-antitoxin system
MNQSADSEILHFAAANGRVIVTADLDFPRLLAALGSTRPGLILLRGGNYSDAESLECVRRVLMSIAEDELLGCIVVVDRERIRRRRLPV